MEKDEEKFFARKRMEKWIKIFLIFLAFVWLCTIISKSIYVSGLPIVKTDTASKKYVEHIVETDGIVAAGGEIAVNTQAGLRVDKIYVRQGDVVKEGDILFTIDTTDIAELISGKETELSKLQSNLSDFQTNAMIDAQKREIAVLWAKEDYETADKETALAKERAKAALDKAQETLEKHLADPAPYTAGNTRRNAWDAYHDWVNEGYRIADKITAKEREIQRLEEQLAELENRADKADGVEKSEPPKVLSGAAGSLEDVIEKDENRTVSEIEKKIENIELENIEIENPETKETETENLGLDETETENPEIESPKTENIEINETETENPEAASLQAPKENKNLVDGEKQTELLNKIKKANKQLLTLRDQLTNHDRDAVTQPDYSAEEAAYDAWQNTKLSLEEALQHAKENYNDVSYAREVALRQKMREIAAAEVTSRADSTAEVYELEINQTKRQIERLDSIKRQRGEIKAEKDGIVSRIQIEVGSRTADTAALLLTDTQRPCQFKFCITKEESKYIHLLDIVAVKLNGLSSTIDVTVDYFTENAQNGYDIVCLLPENVGQPGLSGTVRKSVQGEYHDLALPAEAVYEENSAHYVYTLNEKEGILGSEYYVEKIRVQVKDKNDRYAAIEPGTIRADTKVITYSTEELKQGQSVRPQEK